MTVALLALIALILCGTVLYHAQSVIVPLVLAWLLAQLLGPAVVFLVRHRVPNGLAIGFVLVLLLTAFYWVTMFVSASATSFVQQLPEYRRQMTAMVTDSISRFTSDMTSISDERIKKEINTQLTQLAGRLLSWVGNLVGALTSAIANIVMITIMLAFMLAGKPFGEQKIQRAFSPDVAKRVNSVLGSISANLTNYLFFQFLISLVTGVLVWAACRVIGINSAATWGALAFFLNFIPTIGSIIAGVPPVLLALLQFYPNPWPAINIGIAILVINQVLGSIVSPKIMGDKLDLSPVVILLSLLFWGWLWGIVGAFLSVIFAASIKIACEQIDALHPISVLMESGHRLKPRHRKHRKTT